MGIATFSGNGNYTIDVDAALVSQNRDAKYSTIYWRIIVHKRNTSGHVAWGINGSDGWADSSNGGFPDLWSRTNDLEYNFQNGSYNGDFTIAEGTFNVYHDAAGNASYYVNGRLDLVNLGSAETGTGWRSLPALARVPDAPTSVRIDNISQTTMNYWFSGNGDGGAPILEWQALWQEGGGPQNTVGWNNGLLAMTGLKPATQYNFWSRGRNSVGWGPWSSMMSARTTAGARVKVNGQWKEAIPWIKVNGVWRIAQPYVKTNGAWKKSA